MSIRIVQYEHEETSRVLDGPRRPIAVEKLSTVYAIVATRPVGPVELFLDSSSRTSMTIDERVVRRFGDTNPVEKTVLISNVALPAHERLSTVFKPFPPRVTCN